MNAYIFKLDRPFVSANFILDPFESSYELFDVWVEWIQKGTISLSRTFGPN